MEYEFIMLWGRPFGAGAWTEETNLSGQGIISWDEAYAALDRAAQEAHELFQEPIFCPDNETRIVGGIHMTIYEVPCGIVT